MMIGGHSLGYIIHTILHFSVGACLSNILINKDYDSIKKRFLILAIGGFAAISPDITKFF